MKLLTFALASIPCFAAAPQQSERPWTLFVYGAADNNADGPMLRFLDEVRTALDDDSGIELVLFVDRHERYSSDSTSLGADFTGGRIYRLRAESAERIDPGQAWPELAGSGDPEVDSADAQVLGRFLAFGKARFPAKRYGLLIYSHADGRTMCPDETNKTEMPIPALTSVIGAESSVDFLGLELCNMCGIEIAYQWRPGNGGFSSQVLLAIPNAGPPLQWERAFARIRSKGHATDAPEPHLDPATMSGADFGRLVIEEGERGRRMNTDEGSIESAAVCDLTRAANVKRSLDALAVALSKSDSKEAFERVRDGTFDFAEGHVEGAPYYDLYSLCARAAQSEELSKDARSAASTAANELDQFVLSSFGMGGLKGFEADKSGVFVVFPDGDRDVRARDGSNAKLWSRYRWYSPREGSKRTDAYGRWSFLADGATPGNGEVESWFELLDRWYDTADDKGGLNGYAW